MTKEELKLKISQGESSTLQFKLQWSDNDKIAREMVAFANSRGGAIVFGVEDKTGRIVIESPGCLPGDLTIEKIQLGCAEIRNPLIAQLCAKTMPYRGLGSGITRALKCGERIELINDVERDKFIATIWRGSNSATSDASSATSDANSATSDANSATLDANSATSENNLNKRSSRENIESFVLSVCKDWMSIEELVDRVGKSRSHIRNKIIPSLIAQDKLLMSYPDTPNHPKQKYRAKPKN